MEKEKFRIVRVKKNLKFKSYSKKNLEALQKIPGKVVKAKKFLGFFYQIQGEKTLVFRGDFTFMDLDENKFKKL